MEDDDAEIWLSDLEADHDGSPDTRGLPQMTAPRPQRESPLDRLATSPIGATLALAGMVALSAAVPASFPLTLSAGCLLAYRRLQLTQLRMPLKMPVGAGLDARQVDPVTDRPMPAQGIMFLGHDPGGSELWLDGNDIRQHALVLGCTGSYKTNYLLSLCANALSWGSGLMFVDGKGDVSLYAQMFALCHKFGRTKDLLVLNFMSGFGCAPDAARGRLSMRLNPFRSGSPDSLTQLVVSIMDEVGGDGAMWKGRATAMLSGVLRALCWQRDHKMLDLDVGVLRDHMSLKNLIELADPDLNPDMPEPICKALRSYLSSLPGFQHEKGYRQAQTTLDQHGYLEMMFTQILGSMADIYGHIFDAQGADVDMTDVVLNRRILLVMLPALEKSADEVAKLGKIVVAMLKGMMGSALGSKLEGTWDEVVAHRPTNSPSPFLCILDEVGYYTVPGLAYMAAQARSMGISMVYGSQDINAMKRLNEREADAIIANTSTKIFMKTEADEDALNRPTRRRSAALGKASPLTIMFQDAVVKSSGLFFKMSAKDIGSQRIRSTPLVSPIWDQTEQEDGAEKVS